MADLYDTLQVAPDATQAELRKAYLNLARRNHPDRFGDAERPAAQVRMQEINEAWNTLGVAHKRREYDQLHQVHSNTGDPWRGNREFRPFDDFDPVDRSDVDLDPTITSGSTALPRWVTFMPPLLVVLGVLFFGFGMMVNAAAIIAFAAAAVLLGGACFALLPLIAMSRADRDPYL